MVHTTIDDMDEFIKLAMSDEEEDLVLPEWRRPKSAAYRRERRRKVREAAERGEILPGHKKYSRPVYKRNVLTDRDKEVLQFLATVRVATAEQIASLLGVKKRSALHRLAGLHEWKMIHRIEIWPNSPLVFTLSKRGKREAKKRNWLREHEGSADTIDTIAMKNLMHHLGGSQAVLWMMEHSPLITRDLIMNELEIQRISGHVSTAGEMCSQKRGAVMGDHTRMQMAVQDGMSYWDASMTFGGIWYTYDDTQIRRATHRPDYVVNGHKISDENGKWISCSLAIEIELSMKPDTYIEDIIRGYMRTGKVYDKVIYFYNKSIIRDKFYSIAARMGISKEDFDNRFKFIALPEQRSTALPLARMGVME